MIEEIKNIEIKENTNLRIDLGDLDSLVESIKERGQIQALTVRLSKSKDYKYELVEGFRRIEAMKKLGFTKADIDVKELSDDEVDWLRYDANDKRKANVWWEEARFFIKKNKDGFTQEAIGEIIKKTRDYVMHRLHAYRIFDIERQRSKELSLSQAEEISHAPTEDWKRLMDITINDGVSETQIRALIAKIKKIRDVIETIDNDEKREEARKVIEQTIFDKEMTFRIAMDLIAKSKGLYIEAPEIIKALDELLPDLDEIAKRFPEFIEFNEVDENGIRVIQWIAKLPKSIFDPREWK